MGSVGRASTSHAMQLLLGWELLLRRWPTSESDRAPGTLCTVGSNEHCGVQALQALPSLGLIEVISAWSIVWQSYLGGGGGGAQHE